MARDNIESFMNQFSAGIGTFVGILATNHARFISRDLVQIWANELIEGVLSDSFGLQPLKPETITRKEERGSNYPYTPLMESGDMLAAIQFRIHRPPGQSFDIIEVGLRGEELMIDRGDISMRELLLIHEYGIGVPARPIFSKSAQSIGYRARRIIHRAYTDTATKYAMGYTAQGIKAEMTKGRLTPNNLERFVLIGQNKAAEKLNDEIGIITEDYKFMWVN